MSKIKKTICDKCNKELDRNEIYYDANIIICYEGFDIANETLKRGDYCKKCFKEVINKILEQ